MVLYVLEELLQDTAIRIEIATICYQYYKDQHNDGDAFEKSIEAQIKDVNKKLANMVKAIEMGVVNETT